MKVQKKRSNLTIRPSLFVVLTNAVEGRLVPACTGGCAGARDRGARVVKARDGWIASGRARGPIPGDGKLCVPGTSADAHAVMLAGHPAIV